MDIHFVITGIPRPPFGLSVFGIVGGCLLGILLVPDHPSVPEDLRWASAVFATGMVLSPLWMAARAPVALLHPVALLLFGLVYWLLLDLVQARYLPEVADMDAVRWAFVAIGLFAVGIVLAASRRAAPLPAAMLRAAMVRFSPALLFRVGLIAFFLSFLRFAIPADFDVVRMYDALFAARFAAPWSRGAFGGWDAFLDHLAYFGYLLPALSVLLYRAESRLTWRPFLLAALAILIGLFLAQGGGRRIIGALALSAGVVWVLTARHQGKALLSLMLFGLPALLMYLQYILMTRSTGIGATGAIGTRDLFEGGIAVDDNINRLAQLIEIIPAYVPHVGFDWVLLILVRPIPRVLWPGKPEGLDFDLTTFLGMQNVSLTASVVGESYLAFGLIGCLAVGLVYGYLAGRLVRLLDLSAYSGALLMYVLGLIALFVGLRAAVEVLLFSYALLAWIALVSMFAPKTRRGVA